MLTTFSWKKITLCIVQESIDDEVTADAILSSAMGRRGGFSDGISLENSYDVEGNDICNDWIETLCEYSINDQLDRSVFHLL